MQTISVFSPVYVKYTQGISAFRELFIAPNELLTHDPSMKTGFLSAAQAMFMAAVMIAHPMQSQACETALLLTMDVSNSVDHSEYQIQARGVYEALSDKVVADALVEGQIAVAVVQWAGVNQQVVSLPWHRMYTYADVAAFADRARAMDRAFPMANTAIGDLMMFALNQFGPVADCFRKVVDISGDGQANSGLDPIGARQAAQRAGVQINGLAIESQGLAVTRYYRQRIITRDGFVMTARGHTDYTRVLKAKITRETSRALF